jgi:hypothetical protein
MTVAGLDANGHVAALRFGFDTGLVWRYEDGGSI